MVEEKKNDALQAEVEYRTAVEEAYDYKPEAKSQMIRNGYYSNDYDSKEDDIIINRTVSLKQSFK